MKKTLNINLSGLVFTMDEDAYNTLKNYLEAIERHFQNEVGKEEIIADIESRFAEEFSKKKSSSKEVMTLEDVNAIIATLGMVEDFSAEKNESEQKEIPGTNQFTSRRLYRDPDHALLAGVASGIANYFGVDVVWIRILFVVATFAWGFSILIYILLWIITPKAETAAQRAEMMGEPLTIKAIEEHVKNMVNEGKERLGSFEKKNEGQINGFFREIGGALQNFIKRFFSLFGSLIGFFLFVGAFVGIIFLGIGTGIVIVHRHSPDLGVNIFEYISQASFFLALVFFAGVFLFPLFAILLLGIRLMKKRPTLNGYMTAMIIILWAGSLIGGGIMLSKVAPQIQRMESHVRVAQQGTQNTINEEIAPFETLIIEGAYSVQIEPGETFSLKANGYEGDLKRLKFENTAKELTLYQEDHSGYCFFCYNGKVEIILTAPTSSLKNLQIEGANEVHALSIEGETFTLSTRGANRVTLSGKTDFARFDISGASKIEAFDLEIKALHIDIDGASRANVNVRNNIEGEISGVAKVEYRGTPINNNLIVNDAGQVLDLDPDGPALPPQEPNAPTSRQE